MYKVPEFQITLSTYWGPKDTCRYHLDLYGVVLPQENNNIK